MLKQVKQIFKNETRYSKLGMLLKKAKLRHLKIGPRTLFVLVKWHLRPPGELSKTLHHSWILNSPSISVLITVYNQSEFEILRAIESVRKQNISNLEMLIVDDGSNNPETINCLNQLELLPTEKIFSQGNSGVVLARNFLLSKCNSDYLIFLDPDDELLPNYLTSALDLLRTERHIEIVFPNVLIFTQSTGAFEVWGTGPFHQDTLVQANSLPMSSVVSVKLVKMLGGFSTDFDSGVEDWDFWYRASLSSAIAKHLPIIGYKYSKSETSRSSIAEDNSHLIRLRTAGPKNQIQPSYFNRIQIFLVVPFLPRIGGVEEYVRSTAKFLKSNGFEIALLITESDPFGYEDSSDDFREQGFLVIKRIDFSTDELFCETIDSLKDPINIAINYGSPWAFTHIHGFNSIFRHNAVFVFNTEISLERALHWESFFDELWLGYKAIEESLPSNVLHKSRTIYTGINDLKSASRKSGGARFRVGFLGRLSVEKDPLKFMEIAKAAQLQNKFEFVMGGEGPLLKQVVKEAKKLSNLDFRGYVRETDSFFEEIDCLIITSKVEGIPLVAMEALSHGVPVISTDVGGIAELLAFGENGYTWTGKTQECLDLITKIFEDRVNSNTKTLLPEKFSKSHNYQIIKDLFNDLGIVPVEKT